MAETGRTEDGRPVKRATAFSDWEFIDEAQFESLQQSFGERTVRQLGSNLAETAAEAGGILNPVENLARMGVPIPDAAAPLQAIARADDEQEAARRAVSPEMFWTSQLADPTALVPGGAGAKAVAKGAKGAITGSKIAGGITTRVPAATRALSDAAQQVPGLRMIAPDLPAMSARRTEAARIAEDARPRQGVGAQAAEARRYRPGLQTAEEFEDYAGIPAIDDSIRGYLNAPDSEASGVYSNMMKERSLRERTDASLFEGLMQGERDNLAGSVMDIRDGMNRKYMEKIGADPEVFPDVNTLGDNLRDISAGFKEIEAAAKGPIDLDGLVSKTTEAGEELASDLVDPKVLITGEVKSQLDKVQGWIDDLAEENGTMTPENFGIIRNRLEQEIARKAKSQPDTEVVSFLSDIREKLMDRFSQTLSPEDLAKDRRLRERWGWTMNGLNRSGAIGEKGVNPTSMLNSRGSKVRSTKTGRDNDEFTRFLRTADATLKAIPSSSQTAEAIARIGR